MPDWAIRAAIAHNLRRLRTPFDTAMSFVVAKHRALFGPTALEAGFDSNGVPVGESWQQAEVSRRANHQWKTTHRDIPLSWHKKMPEYLRLIFRVLRDDGKAGLNRRDMDDPKAAPLEWLGKDQKLIWAIWHDFVRPRTSTQNGKGGVPFKAFASYFVKDGEPIRTDYLESRGSDGTIDLALRKKLCKVLDSADYPDMKK